MKPIPVLNPRPQGEAETCFLKSIEVAQKQQAKSLELRAVMSLARLWQQQGKQKEAYRILSEIYNWFTEGFDTKDLQEAKALLESLSLASRSIESKKVKSQRTKGKKQKYPAPGPSVESLSYCIIVKEREAFGASHGNTRTNI